MAIYPYESINGKKLFEVYVNGLDSAGRRVQWRRKGIETRRKAEATEFELRRNLAQLKEQPVPYRWGEWIDECMKRMRISCRPSTVINYETRLKKWTYPRWEKLELQQISKQEIYDTIYEHIGDQLSEYSRRTMLKMVKRIFEMAVEDGILDRNPCAGIKVVVAEVEQKVFTTNEAAKFLRLAKEQSHRFYRVWTFALMTGMRSGEMFALKWSDIDLEGRLISVTKQWTNKNGIGPTKTQRSRVVPISDDLLKFLKEIKLQSGGLDEYVLPRLKEWENGMQSQVTRDFCESNGITQVKFHDLRATFITNLLSNGVSLAKVMSIVGHSQIKTTNGYLRRSGIDLQGATEALGIKIPEAPFSATVLQFKRE